MDLENLPSSDAWIYLASTGAGAGVQDLLWSVPGASVFLAGASFPYSRHESVRFIGYEPEQAVSAETALGIAVASYMRACITCPPGRQPVGVGCTASVTTLVPHRGDHRAWCAVIGYGRVKVTLDMLQKGPTSLRKSDGAYIDVSVVDALLRTIAGTGLFEGEKALKASVLARPFFAASGARRAEPLTRQFMPGAFNPLHRGHLANSSPETIFQLSLATPHKPPVSIVEALGRIAAINDAGHDALLEDASSLYLDKARKWPGSTFIVGTDTLERILDPQYYNCASVNSVLAEMNELCTWFNVSQREGPPYYRELIARVPERLTGMFRLLPETEYASLSSTQLRKEADHDGQE